MWSQVEETSVTGRFSVLILGLNEELKTRRKLLDFFA